MTQYVVGVDLGTGGPKVVLTDTRGAIVGHVKEHVDLRLIKGGGAEQDPDAWWTSIATASRRLRDQFPQEYSQVVAICMSAQWGGLVPVDADGHHTYPALTWMDARGAQYSQKIAGGRFPVAGGYSPAVIGRWLTKTGGAPTLTGKDPVGQAAWLRHERPEVYERTTYLLDVPEYLTMRLTGRAVAGFDTAVLRWCSDNRDPGNVRWDPALTKRVCLDRSQLPQLVSPATVVGTIHNAAADHLRLPRGVQVVTGTGDTTAAAVGAGAIRDYDAHLYIGTSDWISCHVPYKRTDIFTNIASLPSVVPDKYWIATVQDVAGKAIDWLLNEVVYAHDGMLDAEPKPDDALERLNELAASAPPGCHGVVFAPWLNGERTPIDDQTIRGGWFNVSLSTTRADLARSVFEGIALNARWMLDAVEKFVAKEQPGGFDGLRFIGGGARSALWCQALADIMNRPIHQMAEPVLANGRGAALIASVGIGAVEWDEIPDLVQVEHTYQPNQALREVYDKQYAAFRDLYRGTKRLSSRHNR